YRLNQTGTSGLLGTFTEIGTARVTADGQRIETAANAVTETSIYFVAQPRPITTVVGRVLDSDNKPIRFVLIACAGQLALTDGNGSFVIPGVAVPANNQLTVEASYIRANGRTDRITRTGITAQAFSTTRITPDLVLPSPATQPNRPPSLTAPATLTVNTGTTTDFPLLVSDPDPNQSVTVTVTGAAFASIVTNQTAFALRLAPGATAAGNHTLTLRAADNQNPAGVTTRTVSVNVINAANRPPVANAQTVATNEDTPKAITLTGSDADGDALTYAIVAQPARGTLTGTGANLTYTPAAHLNGADVFTFKVNDGKVDGAAATVSINVTPVNDAPVLTVPGAQNATVGQALNFDLSATDVDQGQTLTFSSNNLPSGATLTSIGANGRRFSWTPTANQVGTVAVNFMVSDNGTPSLSDTESVVINVTGGIGSGTGLRGEYFDNVDLTLSKLVRTDATVDFDWGTGSPDPTIDADLFSVRWTGQVQAKFSETYTFYTVSDNGVRLWVNNQLLVDNWTLHTPVENNGTITLVANQKYGIRMEFYEDTILATARLLWSSPSQIKQVIPQASLYPAQNGRSTFIPYAATAYKYKIVNFGEGIGFERLDFDDSIFSTGNAGFGDGCNALRQGNPWPSNTDILLRRKFTLPIGARNLTVGVAIDNAVQVFVNGIDVSAGLIDSGGGCAQRDSSIFNVPNAILRQGENLIAVRGRDHGFNTYLDLRITGDVP
ncbi:MAG: cadherin-like domain-containing protein, partial [Acidobacteria bacterium]|nr:cadherin-like domain-containing protein [Acidobacteriota bacterium]